MKYYLITGRIPESETEAAHDSKIEIGESNPFDTSGKPFRIKYHESLGIVNLEDWKRLIKLYAQRIVHEYFVTPEGLRQHLGDRTKVVPPADPVPAHILISLLHDGFSKQPGEGNTILYVKQKGRIEDDMGQTYTPEQMFKILEDK